ncbi:MAG: glycosyltransferase, partial [Candidatus Angelobacter sp.]
VLAGPLGWRGEELLESARPIKGRKGRVIFTGALEERELAVLLKGAALAVIPSLYEGFCLPMVEAMACGVATVASRSSCLPEVSGDVLRYFDPESVEEMANCIETVLASDAVRKEIAGNGVLRAQRFDWRRSAEETLQVLMAARKD